MSKRKTTCAPSTGDQIFIYVYMCPNSLFSDEQPKGGGHRRRNDQWSRKDYKTRKTPSVQDV